MSRIGTRTGPRWTAMHLRPITDREREVIRLIAEGLTAREIAIKLCLSWRTVHSHIARISAKLGLHSSVEIAVWWVRQEKIK